MPNIFKHFSASKAEDYVFPDVQTLRERARAAGSAPDGARNDEPGVADTRDPNNPIDFASIQADAILADARREAEEILEQARKQAAEESEEIRRQAAEEGRLEGYLQGEQQAEADGRVKQAEQAAQLAADVARFLERAGDELDRQLDRNLDELRDLAIAIAEKVIGISLKSSTEIIGRMVQAALDKRRHREWIHIYIAEGDAKRVGQMPTALSASIAALADRVKIIPMADDDPGTCVIEMPDGIIDASASTQLSNIREMLSSIHQPEERITTFHIQGDANVHIPANGPSGV